MATGLEICVDTIECALTASAAGASRIELCAALSEGGLTPSNGLMLAGANLPVPVYAMIRPRAGGFVYSDAEITVMQQDIDAAKSAGLAGVVFGVLNRAGGLNLVVNKELIARAAPLKCTLHRAIDTVPDALQAMEQAIDLGFERILTSGQQPSAAQGVALIADLVKAARGRISIMPGAGVRADNVAEIVQITGVSEVHSSCSTSVTGAGMFDSAPRSITDAPKVDAMLRALK